MNIEDHLNGRHNLSIFDVCLFACFSFLYSFSFHMEFFLAFFFVIVCCSVEKREAISHIKYNSPTYMYFYLCALKNGFLFVVF